MQGLFPERTCASNKKQECQRGATVITNATDPESNARTGADGEALVPLREEKPKLWLAFLAANLSVYAAGIAIALSVSYDASNEFFLSLAKINSEVVGGEYWRLLTATFMHAGLFHLATNCTSLWVVAPEAEAVYGSAYFAAIFLLSGVAGNVASFMVDDLVTVGASGGIFGLLGALAAYFLRNRGLVQSAGQLSLIGTLLAFDVLLGLDDGSMVDNVGHAAGFASGLWLGWSTCPRWKLLPKKAAPPPKAFDWSSPAAPGPRATSPPSPADTSRATADSPAAAAEPATPTIALLDALLETTPPKPETPAAPKSDASAPLKATETSEATDAKKSEANGASEGGVTSKEADVAPVPGNGGTEGGLTGERGAEAGNAPDGGAIDLSQPAVATSVLASFAFSLVVLTWAGCVANSPGAMPM